MMQNLLRNSCRRRPVSTQKQLIAIMNADMSEIEVFDFNYDYTLAVYLKKRVKIIYELALRFLIKNDQWIFEMDYVRFRITLRFPGCITILKKVSF
jgi:hypothetical protein